MDKTARKRTAIDHADIQAKTETIALVIGNVARWREEGRELLSTGSVHFTELQDLTADVLRDYAPQTVLSPLFGDNYDVVDIAVRLAELGFEGQYRAISESLPNGTMIRNEVRAEAPDLDFDLLMIPLIANDD